MPQKQNSPGDIIHERNIGHIKNVILLKGQGSPMSPQTILKGAVKPLILFHMVGLLREMADSSRNSFSQENLF